MEQNLKEQTATSTEVVSSVEKVHNGLNNINLFDSKQLLAAENFLTKVMKSKIGGIESVNDGLAVLMRAQDLGLPFSTCIEHISVINGKTGVDIHIIKALLSRAGCTWKLIKDYQPVYEYTDGINVYSDNLLPTYAVRCKSQKEALEKAQSDTDKNINDNVYVYPVKWYKDFNNNVYKDYQLSNDKFSIVLNKQQAVQVNKAGKVPVYRIPNQPIDYITEYELTRYINKERVTSIGRYSYNEAIMAGLFNKETYQKYPRVLIGHRAFTLGARDIASDVLFGVMENTELKIVTGKELSERDLSTVEDIEASEI